MEFERRQWVGSKEPYRVFKQNAFLSNAGQPQVTRFPF